MSSSTRRPRFLEDAEGQPPSRFQFTRVHDNARSLRALTPPQELPAFVEPPHSTPLPPAEALEQEATTPPPKVELSAPLPPAAVPEEKVAEAPPVARGLDPRMASAIESLRLRSERLAEEARADALEIGFMVARKILEQELRTSPKALFDLIRSAIRKAGESRKISLRLHPDDCATLSAASDTERNTLTLAQLECIPDSTLSHGDCVVEGDLGIVDGRLASRLSELGRSIEQAFREEVA